MQPADTAVLPDLKAPRSLEEAGLSLDLVTQLALKTLFFSGELTGAELARRMGLLYSVIEPALDVLKAQRHCEVVAGTLLAGPSYRHRITADGRTAAAYFLQQNHYVGAAPVPLGQYRDYMLAYRETVRDTVTRASIREVLEHLVLGDDVLDEIGPAVNSGHSAFVYGPPGNGKTAIARAIGALRAGTMAVPHALEVEGSIIRVFDVVNHRARPVPESQDIAPERGWDRRWELCERPLVVTGGELTIDSLELGYDHRLGYYRAPHQLTANGGTLMIDDFGRQRTAPGELLNRWMVPLESGADFLTLQTGVKFEVPFHAFVVFATNVRPADLVDEAFLRRVQHKVFAGNPTDQAFHRIFERCCADRDVAYDPAVVNALLARVYQPRGIVPRGCHPRDIINQALLLADYAGEPRDLTIDLLERAAAGYFVDARG